MIDGQKMLHLWLSVVARIVPRASRDRWSEEWRSELWELARTETGSTSSWRRASGALPHALWLRWQSWSIEMIGSDLHSALRGLVKRPSFSVVAAATLALGMGGVFALLALSQAVLLAPLPVPEPDRLVWHWGTLPASDSASVSPPDFLDYREATQSYQGFAAMTSSSRQVTITGGDRPARLSARSVTHDLLTVLGLEPELGRGFSWEESEAAAAEAVMISPRVWWDQFGGRADALGEPLRLDGRPHQIVGVIPEELAELPGLDVDLLLPATFGAEGYQVRRYHFLRPIGRLADGVSLGEARAELDHHAKVLEAAYPDSNTGWGVRLVALPEVLTGPVRPTLIILLAAVGAVLLIAAANVSGLLLARSSARADEISLRVALGATRTRLIQLLLAESALLAVAASGLALLFAAGLVRFAQWGAAASLPRIEQADEVLSSPVFIALALGFSLVTGLVFGFVPSLKAARVGLGGSRVVGGRQRSRLRRRLVVFEVATSFLLLTVALLLVHSLGRLNAIDLGFEREGAVTVPINFAGVDDGGVEPQHLLDEVRGLGTISSAALSTVVPMWANRGDTYIHRLDQPPGPSGPATALIAAVTGDYFDTLGIAMLQGRSFESGETGQTVIINQAFAQKFFPEEDPLGHRLVVDLDPESKEHSGWEIVGVVGDVRQFNPAIEPQPEFYLPLDVSEINNVHLLARTRGEPSAAIGPIRAVVQALDAEQPLDPFSSIGEIVHRQVEHQEFQTQVLGLFAALAVFLAVVGLYGLLATLVTDRRDEIGVRVALGAGRADVGRLIAGDAARLIAWGLGLGLIGAVAVSRFISGLLFEVEPLDPPTLIAAAAALAGIGLLGTWQPLQRALRVDPIESLRSD